MKRFERSNELDTALYKNIPFALLVRTSHETGTALGPVSMSDNTMSCRVGVNFAPELDFLANSKSNSGIGIELELALPSPGGIGIELELPSFELELESELRSSELNSELPSWN